MPEVRLPAPVKAQLVPDSDERPDVPGAFNYYTHYRCEDVVRGGEKIRGMVYVCPCGCKRQGALPFRPLTGDDLKYKRASWEWDGNREAPTLSPSVHHVGHWHGWLRKGMWEQA